SGAVLAGIVSGITALACGFLAPRLRPLLPPIVAGIVACMAGLAIIQPALVHVSGIGHGDALDRVNLLICLLTLAVIIGLSVWGGRRHKLFALLVGVIVGIVISAFFGKLHDLDTLASMPLFGWPQLPAITLGIDPGILAAVVVVTIITQIDHFGEVVILHEMNDADWRRPNMKMVSGGMRAGGIGTLIGAFLGAFPNCMSPANIAMAHISRSTSR